MAKVKRKKVVRKRLPDRVEEVEVEIEVEEERPSNAEQLKQIERDAAHCADCQHMAPRRCARHKVSIPV